MHEYLPRALDLSDTLALGSCFLWGPRLTGKSTLIRETLADTVVFDLLNPQHFLAVIDRPSSIEDSIDATTQVVVIDEIQKAPQLLDEVHRLIESRRVRFVLTSSSARKLRRRGVNLLGGRAGIVQFHPLLSREIWNDFNLSRALRYGTLPSVYLSKAPRRILKNYVGAYLQQEIAMEGLTRSLPAFSRFLDVVAHSNATVVNFSSLANDAQVPRTTVHEYFEIVKDTMLVHEVPAWRRSRKRKPIVSSKYYFFDVGVVNSLRARDTYRTETSNGFAFETWIHHELQSWIDYCDRDESLRHWRSNSGFEVDFLIGDHTAIEVKAKSSVGHRDLRGLRALREEGTFRHYLCVCMETRARHVDGIEILPHQMFLRDLWEGAYE